MRGGGGVGVGCGVGKSLFLVPGPVSGYQEPVSGYKGLVSGRFPVKTYGPGPEPIIYYGPMGP